MFPLIFFFVGHVFNEISPTTPHITIGDKIKSASFSFFYLLTPIFFFSFVSFALGILVGEKVGIHFRVKYLEAVLRQDVSILNTHCELIKKGEGEKIASSVISLCLTIGNIIKSF